MIPIGMAESTYALVAAWLAWVTAGNSSSGAVIATAPSRVMALALMYCSMNE